MRVGQFTWNYQVWQQETEDEEEDWGYSNFCDFAGDDKIVSVYCDTCERQGNPIDLTDLAVQCGLTVYEEDKFPRRVA
jgi:hypothetical protein